MSKVSNVEQDNKRKNYCLTKVCYNNCLCDSNSEMVSCAIVSKVMFPQAANLNLHVSSTVIDECIRY